MANRKRQGAILGVLWLVAAVAFVAVIIFYNTPRNAYAGFPHMPLYGAVTWWFFFLIPLIGATWGFFNDWKDDRR